MNTSHWVTRRHHPTLLTSLEAAATALLAAASFFLAPSHADPPGGEEGHTFNFLRGDADSTSTVDSSDIIRILDHLYMGSPGDCLDAQDVDDDGELTLADAVTLILHLYLGQEPPPSPYPSCGPDPTYDGLGCENPFHGEATGSAAVTQGG